MNKRPISDEIDNAGMIRVYARENATQRGHSSTALTGTVAAAMKYLAKCILTGKVDQKFLTNFDLRTVQRRLLGEDGMGQRVLVSFLEEIPGINDGSVQHQLANLKASGDYARLMAEVQAEIAEEEAAAQRAVAVGVELQKRAFIGISVTPVAPQLTVVTHTSARSGVAVLVKDAHAASVVPSETVAHGTTTVRAWSSNGP